MSKAIYKYTLTEDYTQTFINIAFVEVPSANYPIFFYDKLMGTISVINYKNGRLPSISILIKSGYSWDGCSPKIKLGSNIVGVWDGFTNYYTRLPKCYHGSLNHDFLLQFIEQHNLSTNVINLIFKMQLKKDLFELTSLYYNAVCLYFYLKRKLKIK